MDALDKMIAPEEVGKEAKRFVWDGSRHHVMNQVLSLLCLLLIVVIAIYNDFSFYDKPIVQFVLAMFLPLSVYFLIMAIQDYRIRNVRYLAIVGELGFCIIKYNEEENVVLLNYVQSYKSLAQIEKRQRCDVSEDGVYLQTHYQYSFYAPDCKFQLNLKFNRYDIRLSEQGGLSDVKAMRAIEAAYAESKKSAQIEQIEEAEDVIPSHPQSLLRIRKPVMWADLVD